MLAGAPCTASSMSSTAATLLATNSVPRTSGGVLHTSSIIPQARRGRKRNHESGAASLPTCSKRIQSTSVNANIPSTCKSKTVSKSSLNGFVEASKEVTTSAALKDMTTPSASVSNIVFQKSTNQPKDKSNHSTTVGKLSHQRKQHFPPFVNSTSSASVRLSRPGRLIPSSATKRRLKARKYQFITKDRLKAIDNTTKKTKKNRAIDDDVVLVEKPMVSTTSEYIYFF